MMTSRTVELPASDRPFLAPHLDEVKRLGRWAAGFLLAGVLPLLAWVAFAPLASAVIAPAVVKVDLDRRSLQHAEGGTVREVLVRDGQRVRANQPLLVLGDEAVAADVNRLDYRVIADWASVARLEAEQAGAATLTFPPEVLAGARDDARLQDHIAKERSLFVARRESLVGQVGLLRVQQGKISGEIEALQAQARQARQSLAHQVEELETHRRLHRDGFISSTRISQLEAGIADYRVKLEERHSELARAEQRRVDADLRIKSLEMEYRQQASDQLKTAAVRLAEIRQEQRKTVDAAKRQVIVSPVDGDVINLKFAAAGGVVSPREHIADIVPANPRLVVEARLRPEDISRVSLGVPARIRFTAFAFRTTSLVEGKVIYVSPDRLVEQGTNQAYYVAHIEASDASLAANKQITPQAGMPAEVYVDGEHRTALQYLLEPVLQVLRRAGREG